MSGWTITSAWTMAALALLPAFAVPAAMACRGRLSTRWVAFQLASALLGMLLTLLTFAFDQSSFIDLALASSLLTVPGTLLAALFVERWL